MQSYMTRNDATFALRKMQAFYENLKSLYDSNGFNLEDNLGRRNILMSQPQEAFFAEALRRNYPSTLNNGHTGEPDIYIPEISKELECKLTSRHKGGAISFQSDYETLQKKGSLDYLYVVASESFDEFTVVHYSGLTVDDFRSLSPGSRGKVQLKKHVASDKATVLIGEIEDISEQNRQKIKEKLKGVLPDKKRDKLLKSLEYWNTSSTRYRIKTEPLHAAC